jgi:hypothetical protein
MVGQRTWQRITLLTILGYEGLGALVGGAFLVARPDGSAMKIPVAVLHGAFRDFLIPGVILCGLGLLNVVAFIGVWRRSRLDWLGAGLAMGGLAIWFLVEIVIVREVVWLHAMWGLPVVLGILAALPLLPVSGETLRDAFLACGVLSSLLYAAMNALIPLGWNGFDHASRVVSELSAVGAPTRPLWVVLGVFYSLLVTMFGWGIRVAAADNRRLRAAGTLLLVYGLLLNLWPFAPMHLREDLAAGASDWRDTMHIALAAATEVVYLAALALSAAALGRAFRLYSVATALVLFGFGLFTFRDAPGVAANRPTPFVGVWERIDIGLFLLWVVVLAIAVYRRAHAPTDGRAPLRARPQPA